MIETRHPAGNGLNTLASRAPTANTSPTSTACLDDDGGGGPIETATRRPGEREQGNSIEC